MKFQEARQLIQTYIMESPVECTLALNDLANQVERLEAQRKELREALQSIIDDIDSEFGTDYDYSKARAALKATQ